MDLAVGVVETKESSREGRYKVFLVMDVGDRGNVRVDIIRESLVADLNTVSKLEISLLQTKPTLGRP